MTFRHLKIFIAVAQTGSMSAAARELYIAQPTVSQVIAEIENEYGIRLFERLSRRLYITREGRQLLDYARHITALFEEMERDLHYASRNRTLRVGATITVGSCVLPTLVARFEAENPSDTVEVLVDNTRVIEEKILSSELDFGLVEGDVTEPDLLSRPVLRDELVLICAEGHPFCSRTRITMAGLEGEPFVLREPGSGTREQFEAELEHRGIHVRAKWVCHSADSILEAVARGQGLSVISRRLAEQALPIKKLRILPIQDAELSRTFNLVYHRNKFLSEPIQAFFQLLSGEMETQLGS